MYSTIVDIGKLLREFYSMELLTINPNKSYYITLLKFIKFTITLINKIKVKNKLHKTHPVRGLLKVSMYSRFSILK